MANGKTTELKKHQLNVLKKKYDATRVKNDLAKQYNLPVQTIKKVIDTGRCSERIFNILFNVG